MKRPEIKRRAVRSSGGLYFAAEKSLSLIPTGCTVLDCVVGGGWPLGRMCNIVGDASTGKTLLAIEACANFALKYPDGRIKYNESESAFDLVYARSIGLPVDRVELGDADTVEELFADLESEIANAVEDEPVLYVVDSLDSLTDQAELNTAFDAGTYGMSKQKQLSKLFRRLVRQMGDKKICLMIVSQVRDKIGVSFGMTKMRTGGKALDFYASQIVWLSQVKTLKERRKGVERPVGIIVRAKCRKNKVGVPFRECEFPLMFNYGVDDIRASVEFLKECKRLDEVRWVSNKSQLLAAVRKIHSLPDSEFRSAQRELSRLVRRTWLEIEDSFQPVRSKYGVT